MSTFSQISPGSYTEIRTIHSKGIAVPNKIYYGYGKDGTLRSYRGTHEGRLKEETTIIINEENINDNEEAIEGNREIIDSNTERIIELEKNKADKCYALAMAIVL